MLTHRTTTAVRVWPGFRWSLGDVCCSAVVIGVLVSCSMRLLHVRAACAVEWRARVL